MKKLILLALSCLSFELTTMPPKKQNNAQLETLQAKSKKQKSEIASLHNRIEELKEENKQLKIALQPDIKYKSQTAKATVQGTEETIAINIEHTLNPQYDIVDVRGGHQFGTLQKLQNRGLVEIVSEKYFASKNGCKEVTARTNSGVVVTKTEFPDTWNAANITSKLTDPKNTLLNEEIGKDGNIVQHIQTPENIIARMILARNFSGSHEMITAYPVSKAPKI